MPSEEAFITPAVLRWAREQAGYTEEAASKLGVKPQRVEAWEAGKAPITVARLDALAQLYKRPTALFYLPAPPQESFSRPTDFRDLRSDRMTPGLIYQIRHAEERREIARDLFREIGDAPARFSFACTRDEDPEPVGTRLREFLGVAWQTQSAWGQGDATGYTTLRAWKDATETAGVMVFQAPRKDLDQVRGFSIHADVLPIVVLASGDVPVARCFTLLHELAHLGLREGGICDLHDADTELFCNQVAAATLMPLRELSAEINAFRESSADRWPDAELRRLARKFSVSEQALVLRFVTVGAAPWDFYKQKRHEFDLRNRQAKARKDDEGGFVPPHQLSIARNGTPFTRLVLEAYHRGVLTSHRASSYLGVSFETLGKLELEISRQLLKAS